MCEDNRESNVIVVTGFGPFGPHKVNDSWECVKRLKELNIEDDLNIILVTQEIPVIYSASDKEVPSLWRKYSPILVVHVGVHNSADIVIEKCARKEGYCRPDVSGCSTTSCSLGTKENISTFLDLETIINSVDSRGIPLSISSDAGMYLCEYTYYLSLCQDPKRTIFIHIPPAGTAPTIQDKTVALKNIITSIFHQLRE